MRIFQILMLSLGLLGIPVAIVRAASSESVMHFRSDLTPQSDTSLQVKEIIIYSTDTAKHGIYRYIPYRYNRDGALFTAAISNFSVQDGQGNPLPFTQSNSNGVLTYKIGSADQTFTGTKTFVLNYTVANALMQTKNGPRLYWDITGEGWNFPIEESEVFIHTKATNVIQAKCYAGVVGGDNGSCQSSPVDEGIAFTDSKAITFGSNLTVDVYFSPAAGFIFPSPTQVMLKSLKDNLFLLFFSIPIPVAIWVWYKYGRDYMFTRYNVFDQSNRPVQLKPICWRQAPPFVYEPLDISPGQAGAILDEHYDNQDLVADIIDLARKKYLKIEQTQAKTLFKPADYRFTKLKTTQAKLPQHQRQILDGIFASGDEVTLSALKGKFYQLLPVIQTQVITNLYEANMFTRDPNKARGLIALGALGFGIVYFLLFKFGAELTLAISPLLIGILILDVVAAIWCFINIPQKTAKGFNYQQQARGLQETIKRGKWREEIMEKHLFLEEMLPFAIALGVVERLARDMEALKVEPPSYIGGVGWNNLATYSLINSFTSEVGSSLSYNPSSASWSSGGGGFSGGGGGGGGGGSW